MVGQVFDFIVVSTLPSTKSSPEGTDVDSPLPSPKSLLKDTTTSIKIYADTSTKEAPEDKEEKSQQEKKVQDVFGFEVVPWSTSKTLFVVGKVTTPPGESTKHVVDLEEGTAQRLNHGIRLRILRAVFESG